MGERDLGMGTIMECFQEEGKEPVETDWLNM